MLEKLELIFFYRYKMGTCGNNKKIIKNRVK